MIFIARNLLARETRQKFAAAVPQSMSSLQAVNKIDEFDLTTALGKDLRFAASIRLLKPIQTGYQRIP
jgi:hypothetical protein